MKEQHKELRFLIFGDVFGKLGRYIIKENIDELKSKYKPDLIIANAENVSHGAGVSVNAISELMDYGVEFFTGGNHSFDNKPGNSVYEIENIPLIRPANFIKGPGVGYKIIEIGKYRVMIINLLGTLFMDDEVHNPFTTAAQILKECSKEKLNAVIVDFHAETTSEKIAFGMDLDGKVSLVYGTHTHVPTADERIFKEGTGYLTDIGFNGPLDSVIGINPEAVIHNFKSSTKKRTGIVEHGGRYMNALFVCVDPETGKCTKIERISKQY